MMSKFLAVRRLAPALARSFCNAGAPNLTLYTSGTPNGHKVSIMIEEMGVDYKLHEVDLQVREHRERRPNHCAHQ